MENPLPFSFARQHQLLLDQQHSVIYSGPDTSASALMQLRRQLQSVPQVESLTKDEFEGKLREFYGSNHQGSASVMADLGDFADMESAAREVERDADLLDGTDDAPVIKLLNAIFLEALSEKASDIHIEPYEDSAAVRFRLDGVLRSVLNPSVHIAPLLVSRIKVMAKLDIAEKRLPQDGRMSVRLGGRAVDMRVSTLPSSYGERVVMRLLDKDATHLDLNDLGMDQTIRSDMEELVKRPHGIILVTGPTGSGKTTSMPLWNVWTDSCSTS
jgi:general secretion pathway protein E